MPPPCPVTAPPRAALPLVKLSLAVPASDLFVGLVGRCFIWAGACIVKVFHHYFSRTGVHTEVDEKSLRRAKPLSSQCGGGDSYRDDEPPLNSDLHRYLFGL